MPNYDPISALMSPVSGEDELRALADSLRKRKRAADFYSATTIKPLQQAGQQEGQDVMGIAERQGVLRQALAERQAKQAEYAADREFRKSEGVLDRNATMLAAAIKAKNAGTASKPPANYMWKNPDDPREGVIPIPDGPADIKQTNADEADAKKRESLLANVAGATEVADNALKNLSIWTTGPLGQGIGKIGMAGTDRKALEADIFTLKSKLTLDNMAALKALSATGSTGFGSLSTIEGDKLASSVTSLDIDMPPEKLKANLETIKKHYKNMIDMSNGITPEEYATPEDDGWSIEAVD